MSYGNTHRFLLRTIASQSVMSLEETKKLVVQKEGNTQVNLKEMLKEINENIKPFKQLIEVVKDEITSKEMVVFLSLGYDDTSKAQNVFLPAELEFFRLLMEEIMSTDTREINETTAINVRNKVKVKVLHITDAERLLNIWCRMKYLDHEDNNYALGVRAIHEFESYFKNTNADTESMKCYLCTSIVFRGYNCPYCPKTIHSSCLDIHLKKTKTWPCCKNKYVHKDLEALRGGSSRANEISRMTQQLESTEIREEVPARHNLEESVEEMEVEESSTGNLQRPRKRKRLSSP